MDHKWKIFLTLLITYIYFSNWVGWGEESLYLLTESIVEHKDFTITERAYLTGDRSLFNGEYYANKAPGLSFYSIFPYYAYKTLYDVVWGKNHVNVINYTLPDLLKKHCGLRTPITYNLYDLLGRLLLVITSGPIFGALTALLLYELIGEYTENRKNQALVTLAYGLGTLAFHQSRLFYYHQFTALLLFASFYILFRIKEGRAKTKQTTLAGILLGYAITTDLSAPLGVIPIILYAITCLNKKQISFLTVGVIIGVTPLLYYNYSTTGNPLNNLGITSVDECTLVSCATTKAIITIKPNPNIMMRMLIGPYRGLFYFYPILLLAIPGLLRMREKYRKEKLLITLISLTYLTYFSSWLCWMGPASISTRYLTPITPFLMVPVAYSMKETNKKVITILLLISVFNNLITLHPSEMGALDLKTFNIKKEYQEKLDTLQPLGWPLYQYYLPLTLEYGPRARIIEHLAGGFTIIDIRDYAPYQPRLPPFVNLIPLALILALVWRREVFDRKGGTWIAWARSWAQKIMKALSILAALFTVYLAITLLTHTPSEYDPPINPVFAAAILILGSMIAYMVYCITRLLKQETNAKKAHSPRKPPTGIT